MSQMSWWGGDGQDGSKADNHKGINVETSAYRIRAWQTSDGEYVLNVSSGKYTQGWWRADRQGQQSEHGFGNVPNNQQNTNERTPRPIFAVSSGKSGKVVSRSRLQ